MVSSSQPVRSDTDLREYCGAFGIYSFTGKDVAHDIYMALMNLQHRGQDAAGIATLSKGEIMLHKGVGQVDDVFHEQKTLEGLKGSIGIGHVRYPTCIVPSSNVLFCPAPA